MNRGLLEAENPARGGWLRPPRVDEPEWLDLGRGAQDDVAANLAEMERINRWLGGRQALLRHLCPRLLAADAACRRSGDGPLSVLDLGTGAAGLPAAIDRWAAGRGLAPRLIGLDWAPRNLAVAAGRTCGAAAVNLLRADATHLPFPHDGVDFVISSLFMHHFAPADLVPLLRAAHTAARRGIVMSDLVRGRLPYLAFKLVQPVFARHYLTRNDGALSIRRAYTLGEMLDMAAAAGLANARVYAHWPWRMTLVADK